MGFAVVDNLIQLQDVEVKLMENIRQCICMRIKCDKDYAASLIAISSCANNDLSPEDVQKTNVGKAWTVIVGAMESLGKLVLRSAEEMARQVVEELDYLLSEKRQLKRDFVEEHSKLVNEFDMLQKSVKKTNRDYKKCLANYMTTKAKYEDQYLRLPNSSSSDNQKQESSKTMKKFFKTKNKYKKLCQKLHTLHNDYCLVTEEAKQYEQDLRQALVPNLLAFQEKMLSEANESWKELLIKFVQKSDLTQDGYQQIQSSMKESVENIINDNIYSDLFVRLGDYEIEPVKIEFDSKILEDYVGNLQPNQLTIDSFTLDQLKERDIELQNNLTESQKNLKKKEKQLKIYEDEIKALAAISNDNTTVHSGITTRRRAIDIIKKEIVMVERRHERQHQIWEQIDYCLYKFSDNQIPSGLELDLNLDKAAVNCNSNEQLEHSKETYTGSLARTFLKKFRNNKKTFSVSTLATTSDISNSSGSVVISRRHQQTPADLAGKDWFHGELPRNDCTKLLVEDGDFLVRQTHRHNQMCFVVSVKWIDFRHFIIDIDSEGQFKFEGPSFTNISQLVDFYHQNQMVVTQRSGALLLNPIVREQWELSHEDIELKEKVGRGNFGDVYRGILRKTGTGTMREMPVAVKTCKISLPDEQKRKFLMEGRILRQYDHPNVVKLIGIAVHRQPVMIVMELVDGGSLLCYLRSQKALPMMVLLQMCVDVASGMEYLESQSCIHRDLAARNCLIASDKTVKISDFGMSREAPEQEYTVSGGMKQIPIKWTAPEALNYGRYTSMCDVWSFGILMWEVFTSGDAPYSGMSNSKARELIDGGYRLPCPDSAPQSVYKIMKSCWLYEPEDRPHFSQLKKQLLELQSKLEIS